MNVGLLGLGSSRPESSQPGSTWPGYLSLAGPIYEGQSKITEPYLITFKFCIVNNKCDYFL